MLREPTLADGAPRTLTTRVSAARAAAVARAVTPLVGGALALHREFERYGRSGTPTDGHDAVAGPSTGPSDGPPLDAFADQLLASAQLLAECVRRTGGVVRARRGDATALDHAPSDVASDTADAPAAGDALRRLLAGEHEFARGLRHAIAACDAHADDRTADCLEEVLDEVRRQQAVLSSLLAAKRD